MEGSWGPLEPKTSALDSLLGAPSTIPRQLSAIIGAKRLPKWAPGGAPKEVQNRIGLKMLKSVQLVHRTQDLNDFPVLRGSLWLPKWGPKRDLDTKGS